MVLLHSEKIKPGFKAPDFSLPSVDGKNYRLADFANSQLLVLMFICNHCPYVKAVEERFLKLAHDYSEKGVQFVGICSNDPTDYPDDSPESLLKNWKEKNFGFPYLIDEQQDVAKAYGVVCTPEFYVFDKDRKLVYHGQLDDNWKEPQKVTRQDLKEALDHLLNGKPTATQQTPSMGCSIKWKKEI